MLIIQWLEGDFLSYLKSWEDSVEKRPNFKKAEKNRMLLSDVTLEGIRMTGKNVATRSCIYPPLVFISLLHTHTHTHTHPYTHTHTSIHTHAHSRM